MNNNNTPNTPSGEKKHGGLVAAFAGILFVVCALLFTSGMVIPASDDTAEVLAYYDNVSELSQSLNSDTVSFVYALPVTYNLPWNEEPTPVPDPECFTDTTYEDDSISVKYWTERHYDSDVHFAEVKIKSPTQIRTMLSGGSYNSSERFVPNQLAQQINAVVAVNGDFYGYRAKGYIIRQNVTYRTHTIGWDLLLIDDKGDFHIVNDFALERSNILNDYHIVNTLHFGPSLIVDGKIKILSKKSGCGEKWNYIDSPRTAIGQLGELHYLLCVVEGRSDTSRGMVMDELAKVMYEHDCLQAYNLDGGQSSTLVFNGKPMNKPLWGGRRVMSDIVFFATAVPNEQ
ncbi:MAG: phosphodiester glycosidase family protein [Clostridia bacterium]|nr:phosphodiester glycosidase family protein [Clostridia bacterium]